MADQTKIKELQRQIQYQKDYKSTKGESVHFTQSIANLEAQLEKARVMLPGEGASGGKKEIGDVGALMAERQVEDVFGDWLTPEEVGAVGVSEGAGASREEIRRTAFEDFTTQWPAGHEFAFQTAPVRAPSLTAPSAVPSGGGSGGGGGGWFTPPGQAELGVAEIVAGSQAKEREARTERISSFQDFIAPYLDKFSWWGEDKAGAPRESSAAQQALEASILRRGGKSQGELSSLLARRGIYRGGPSAAAAAELQAGIESRIALSRANFEETEAARRSQESIARKQAFATLMGNITSQIGRM